MALNLSLYKALGIRLISAPVPPGAIDAILNESIGEVTCTSDATVALGAELNKNIGDVTCSATGTVVSTTLLDVDFTALTLGGYSAASFLTATGLTFTRSTISTVQTSAATLDATPAIDAACIGNRGSGQGLVIQQNTYNKLAGLAPRNLSSGWTPGTATVTYPYAETSPDGTVGVSRTNGSSGQYAPFGNAPSSARNTFSAWLRSTDQAVNGTMQMVWITAAPGDGIQVTRAASNTWARSYLVNGTVARQYFDVSDGRNFLASGGDGPTARDVLADYMQYESGNFPTEAIATGITYRANDRASYSPGSALVTPTNRIRFYAKMIPKFASSDQVFYDGSGGSGTASAWFLFSWGGAGNNYAKINDSDKKLRVRIAGGTEVVSTNAVSFAMYDTIEWDIEVGNNVASVARYRVNAGAWVDLVLATIPNVPAPAAGAVALWYNDAGAATADSGQFPSWVQKVTFYTDSGIYP